MTTRGVASGMNNQPGIYPYGLPDRPERFILKHSETQTPR